MARLLVAAKKGSRGHKHTIYLPDDKNGMTTVNNGHSHEVRTEENIIAAFNPAEQIDPMRPTQALMRETKLVVLPAADGHTHDIKLLEADSVEAIEKEEENDIVEMLYKMRKKAQEFDSESREAALDDERYLTEDQWAHGDRAEMEKTQRPALTANTAQSKLKSLEGYQRNNRTDLKFYPVEDGDTKATDIYNELAKVTLERINYWQEETEAFRSAIAVGLGVLYGYVDYEDDIKGFPKITFIDWKKVFFGPHYRKDCSDMEYFTIEDAYSIEKIKSMYPEKADEIQSMLSEKSSKDSIDINSDWMSDNSYWDPTTIDDLNKTIRVVELQRYEYDTQYIFVDKANVENVLNITGMSKADRDNLETLPDIKIVPKSNRKIRMIKVAGRILLYDGYPETLTNKFTLWPLYAEKDRNKWRGKIRFIKDLCKANNKYLSVGTDILNKMNAYLWFISEDMFDTAQDMEEFKKNASKPGYVAKILRGDNLPKREQGVKYPGEIQNAMQFNFQMIDYIMNVNPELMGQRSTADSGVQELERKKAALLGNEYLFDNLSMVKKEIGRWLLHVFHKVYGPERIMRIINNYNQRVPVKVGGQPYEKVSQQEIMQIISNDDPANYDVIISETGQSVSQKMANYVMLSELAGKGVPIPAPLLLEFAPLTDEQRQKAMDYVNQEMQMRQAQEQAKQQTEIDKTRIAAMSKAMKPIQG